MRMRFTLQIKNMACMEQNFINMSGHGDNVVPIQSTPSVFQVSEI